MHHFFYFFFFRGNNSPGRLGRRSPGSGACVGRTGITGAVGEDLRALGGGGRPGIAQQVRGEVACAGPGCGRSSCRHPLPINPFLVGCSVVLQSQQSQTRRAVGISRRAGVSVESKTVVMGQSFAAGTPVQIAAVLRCRPVPGRDGSPIPNTSVPSGTEAFNGAVVAFPVCHSLDHRSGSPDHWPPPLCAGDSMVTA